MPEQPRAITGARLLDGLGNAAQDEAVILIEGDSISAVGHPRDVPMPDGAEIIDLTGMTVLPGLIDAHVHLYGRRTMNPRDHVFVGEGLRVARATADLRKLLAAGITTVRECGSYTGFALKQAQAEGSIAGPRLLVVGRFVEPTGGADDQLYVPLEWVLQAKAGPRMADGPAEVRRAVREQVRDGADWIKTCGTGAVMTQAGSDVNRLEWSDEELGAMVDEAHRHGKGVAVHAHAVSGIRQALVAGADTIEHGTYLDDECARMMADSGRYLVPTFFVFHQIAFKGSELGTPEWAIRKAQEIVDGHRRSFERALRHGIPIAMGTDCGGQDLLPHGVNALELELMVNAGLSPMDAVVAGTSGAARCIGVERETGSIEPGKHADLIAVADDPLANIAALQNVAWVMQRGEVVKDRGPLPPPLP